ncbi:MAG TPA: amino acid deaminase/aldolase [Rugosimonospora sp.]|nr:amino acid deaminase/aldolase [Rugosimonospora sp.]
MPAASAHRATDRAAGRSGLRERYDHATAALDPPLAIVDLDAFDANAAAMVARAAGKPLRVASKSVRSRELLHRVLATPGWRGILAYTLPEALWLAGSGLSDDVVVAYPTASVEGLRALAGDEALAAAVTGMVDSPAHLDFIDSVVPPRRRPPLRLCLELDASWRPVRGRVHVGVRRSPVHSPGQARDLARVVAGRAGYRLVGVMSYEAQIAGLGDRPGGAPLRAAAIRFMQRRSLAELVARRGAAISAVREYADLEFVNGGGTGSVARTAADPAVTEIAAGSGLYGPVLFDAYSAWRPEPAAFFALPVVRRPGPRLATVLGGGWIASGPPERSRQPVPWLPAGLRTLPFEGAGEVQTPLTGPAAATLRIGERVWFRHAKAGELGEHVNELHLVSGDAVVGAVATYRGEHVAFL